MGRPEKDRVTKFRIFTVWQEGKEEQWLKTMSAKGWHLCRVGFLNYEFEKGEPRDYEYSLDFRLEARCDMQEYLGLIEDSGWKHLGNMGGWQYFRIDADRAGLAPIYSDEESLAGKYRRVLVVLCVSGLPLMIMLSTGSLNRPAVTDTFIGYLIGAVLILLVYAAFRTLLTIVRLRSIQDP